VILAPLLAVTVTVTVCVIADPLAGVTVSVYVVVEVGLTLTEALLVMARFPGVITPVPPVKTAVRLLLAPAVIDAGVAVKLEMEGDITFGVTVTVTV
jgi:hypothetical protein